MAARRKTALIRASVVDSASEFEKICEALRSLLAGEYQRGSEDTAQRILGLVGANNNNGYDKGGIVSPVLTRVPRGTARAFVEKCLQRGPGKISEIRHQAQSSIEKMLSYQTIRLECLRGIKNKRYKKNKDRFELVR